MTGGAGAGVAVEEEGRALKVHTESPHLVSLGGGRLSTAVTLHPLPEGRTTVGSAPTADIVVQGTGVEATHCYIDTQGGVVTLHPVAEMTSVDNQRIYQPTRLSQEDSLMTTSLVEGKPPAVPRRSWESWDGFSSASSEELAKYISPKVFPAGSSTVNSPAALVLGPRANQNKLTLLPLRLNGESEPKLQNGNIYQNVCALPNGQYAPRVDSPSGRRVHSPSPPPPSPSKPLSPRSFNTPSPAFDRNPSYPFRKSVSSPVPNSWSSDDINGESELRRKQAETERMVEQEAERLERQRLDEILLMCADYEKQAQCDKQNKPQQNRIITNGSLPRDKRLPSPSSPHFHQSFTYDNESTPTNSDFRNTNLEGEFKHSPDVHPPSSPRTRIRTIAAKDMSREYALEIIENRLAILNDYETLGPPPPPRNSSRNALTSPQIRENRTQPTSPNEQRVNSPNNFNFDFYNNKVNENNNRPYKPYSIAEANALSKYEFLGFNPRTGKEVTQSYQSFKKSDESLMSETSRTRDSLKSEEESTLKDKDNSSWSTADLIANCNGDTIKRQEHKNGECTAEQLLMQLDAIVQESMKSCEETEEREKLTPSPKSSERDSGIAETAARDSGIGENRDSRIRDSRDSGKFTMPLPESSEILASLRAERTQLVANLTTLKAKVMEIEQQEDELMRELEIERALLGGELQAQNDKLSAEERKVGSLKRRVEDCERQMEKCVAHQSERQGQARHRLEQQQQLLATLEQQMMKSTDDSELREELFESCKQQQELLEAERKSFEDLEFTLLEEEAVWLSRREELQREVSDAMTRCAERRDKLHSLQKQRDEAVRNASQNTKSLETQLVELIHKIDHGRKRLKEIDQQLQNPNKHSLMDHEEKKQSQDDIERISRVTSGAPIEMSSNSLGRRTIASLQEIERNRQLHLAKQGSLVIEEERKRVSELKRRVQDEARAEYEERRAREINCQSLNSVGSEESGRTESASSEDAEKRLTNGVSVDKAEESQNEDPSKEPQNHKEDERHEEPVSESRPLSDASSYSEDQLTVRMRNKSTNNLQRPLTRYLPIRGESLDLRQHIESAGHQVDLCPHVLLDKTSCRGFLHKMTSRFRNWNKRWFVFDRTRRTLTYYTDRSEKKPKGGAYFQAIEEVYVDHSNVRSPNPSVTFVIKSSERTYHLVAPSPEAMRIWVDVIFTGAEGYQEFAHGS
ncbi:pleckstrin homology-like domain family B member 1 isoform X2 [Macrosteles quadrilineatus]|uniref:pleckstrin homology-like domain family B member 1 isoform X2 n=1 Tax=Macrosteles quadrilineatus TaxID=74068 RepID=UPI0023E2F4E2|nr:pleckstrin homology-like domain family B member 1 isoform X2 [Macrosteles quadrilineatus]